MKEHARMTLREKALKAAEKYTRDVAINTIAFSWPKQAVKDGGL